MTMAFGKLRGLYHGWFIVLACNVVACITWGVAIFNQGVFAAYWIEAYSWSPAALSLAPALFQLWAGVAGIVVGRSVDRFGPRPVILAGAGFICASLWAIASVTQLWHVYPAFLLMGTGFACIHTVTLGKIVARWFRAQRGRAMAAATFGAGVGGAALVPLNAALIEAYGPAAGCMALGAVTVLALVPMALWVIKDGPETMGLEIDGGQKAASSAAPASPTAAAEAPDPDARVWSVAEAMRRMAFWGLALCLGFGMMAQSAFLFHQAPFLKDQIGMMAAAGVISITTLAGIAGRVVFILIGDRLSPRVWSTLIYAAQALAFAILALSESRIGLTAGSALFGLTMGLVITIQPLTVAYVFGRESFGRIYGVIYLAIRIGAAIGPVVIGGILALAGGYAIGWMAVAASLLIAILILPMSLRPAT